MKNTWANSANNLNQLLNDSNILSPEYFSTIQSYNFQKTIPDDYKDNYKKQLINVLKNLYIH